MSAPLRDSTERARTRTGVALACSWSGGKDSCLALHLASTRTARPKLLLTAFTEDETRTRSHGLHRSVIEAQSDALGLELRGVSTSWEGYRDAFVGMLAAARREGIGAVVFGDIDIAAHRDWELGVAREAGLRGILPLWSCTRREVLEAWWWLGFRARIVAVRDGVVSRDFLGRVLDAEVADALEAQGVDACGENGEFHTLAFDGPAFRQPLKVVPGPHVKRADCWFEDLRVS